MAMVGVRMGERLLMVGCAHGSRTGAIASQVGLSGRSVVIVADDASLNRARKGTEQAGVLAELQIAPLTRLPVEDDAFDVAVIDDVGGLFGSLRAEERVLTLREVFRALRPGGRVVVIQAGRRAGLGALLSRTAASSIDPIAVLEADGFRAARPLAEREGLVFVEAVKPRM